MIKYFPLTSEDLKKGLTPEQRAFLDKHLNPRPLAKRPAKKKQKSA